MFTRVQHSRRVGASRYIKTTSIITILRSIYPLARFILETDNSSGRTCILTRQAFPISSDNPSVYKVKMGKQTDYPSRRTICLVRQCKAVIVDIPRKRQESVSLLVTALFALCFYYYANYGKNFI